MKAVLNVSAGISAFENPTLVHRRNLINLDKVFVHSPSSMRLIESPVSYRKQGIQKGDWLLVDEALQPLLNDVVLVQKYDEQYIIRFSELKRHYVQGDSNDLMVVGVITVSVHHYRCPKSLPCHTSMNELSLHQLLVDREIATIFCRARGESMLPYIHDSDIMVLERHLKPCSGDIAVLALNHNLVCKRIDIERGLLYSDNPKFKTHKVDANSDYLRMHGVVRYSLRLHREITSC